MNLIKAKWLIVHVEACACDTSSTSSANTNSIIPGTISQITPQMYTLPTSQDPLVITDRCALQTSDGKKSNVLYGWAGRHD